ncbi:hypothetical protein ES703_124891 [subsurface metagenome]
MRLLKTKFRTFKEMTEIMDLDKYPAGDRRRMDIMLDAMRMMNARPWWRRISWKLKEVEPFRNNW